LAVVAVVAPMAVVAVVVVNCECSPVNQFRLEMY
jgi:hypothetical protein